MRDSSLMALAVPSLDGQPDGLTSVFGLHDLLLQFVEPLAGVKHLADLSVLADEDAALGVLGGVASMNADSAEHRHSEQYGKPFLHLRRP